MSDIIHQFWRQWQRYCLRVRYLPFLKKLLFVVFKFSPLMYSAYRFCCEKLQQDAEVQRCHSFVYSPRISILTPLYNTPLPFLQAMIESVLAQTYENFELCLVDGSDAEHREVYEIAEVYASHDSRIRLQKLKENGGISANSQAALDLATGEYIALLDHDDLLAPHALYEVLCALNRGASLPDFLYSDEDKVDWQGTHLFGPVFKPDFSTAALETNNYICHLAVMSRELLQEAGAFFDTRFDGAQDYDLFLRCTERARFICHIPKVLYHWRVHRESTAAGGAAKPYTHEAGRHALEEHFKRMGQQVIVCDDPSGAPNCYCIHSQEPFLH